MYANFWLEFGVLWVVAILSTLAVLPYALSMKNPQMAQVKLSKTQLLLITVLQNGILMAIAIGVGLLAAHAVGLPTPILAGLLAGTGLPALFAAHAILAAAIGFIWRAADRRPGSQVLPGADP